MARHRLNRNFFQNILRRARYIYLRLILLPGTPHNLAMGLAVGVFVGFLPIIPIQTLVAVVLAFVFRGSKIAAAVGTWVTNPVTVPPLYALFFLIGRTLTPFGRGAQFPKTWDIYQIAQIGTDVVLAGLIGGAVLGFIFAPLSYFLMRKYSVRLQTWEREKMRKKLGYPPTVIG
ncbi:MAG: DUF2062 domain-containing protein [Pseudomonadota bacterium]